MKILRFRLVISVMAKLVLLTHSAFAWADPPTSPNPPSEAPEPVIVAFEYDAPPTCPREERAFSLVHRRSNRVVRGAPDVALQILLMQVRADSAGFRGVLTVTRPGQPEEQRAMKGAHCDEVVEALALTAALSIDPNATLTLGPLIDETQRSLPISRPGKIAILRPETANLSTNVRRGPKLEAPPSHEINSQSDLAPNSKNTAAQSRAGRPESTAKLSQTLRFSVGPVVALRKIMDNTTHFGGGLSLTASRLDYRTFFPIEAKLNILGLLSPSPEQSGTIRTRFVLGQLGVCPVRLGQRFSLMLCPLLELGALLAKGVDLEGSTDKTRWFMALGGELWFRALLAEHWNIWLAPSLLFPLTKRNFAVNPDQELVTSTLPVTWGASAGLAWLF